MYFRLVPSPEHFQTAAKHGRRKTLERRASMQRTVRIATFGIALAILFLLGTVPSAQAQDHSCSNATLDGSFGFSGTGTVFNPSASLFAQVGRQTFDGNGNTDATATTSINGASFPVTIKGTYTVNADCTGSLTLQVSPVGLTVHADFVIASDGAEFRAIVTDPGSVVTVVAKKQFRRQN
jgi:hypothetical protein